MLDKKICVVGLGYVGLPLAIGLAKTFQTTGFDINQKRIKELESGFDRTQEVTAQDLNDSSLRYAKDLSQVGDQDLWIITVPTPVKEDRSPDLEPLRHACQMIGVFLKKGSIVVFESTVYPGVTESFCGPVLEGSSGLVCGQDFFLGYSPERINPGDRHHSLQTITKVVSGQTEPVTNLLVALYGSLNGGNIFAAKNIRTAEAAKVIENAQRDINVAFINEVAMIMNRLGLSCSDVLDAARTKWNFLPFHPGLVGGHCIGVDPYYLADCARQNGLEPRVILAGRQTNEDMSRFIAQSTFDYFRKHNISVPRLLVLGLAFKENIPDIRNTKVIDVLNEWRLLCPAIQIDVHDCYADPEEVKNFLGLVVSKEFPETQGQYDGIISLVAHDPYKKLGSETLEKWLRPGGGFIADMRCLWREQKFARQTTYWTL